MPGLTATAASFIGSAGTGSGALEHPITARQITPVSVVLMVVFPLVTEPAFLIDVPGKRL
jgi:hypothetical protein